MVIFLLKSSACLAIFLMFYKLLLENESMHVFKRYYLLAALLLSLAIPTIPFTEYVDAATITSTDYTIHSNTAVEESLVDYWPAILWTIYGLGVLLFSLKFAYNLRKIDQNIRSNPKVKIGAIINVLLRDAIVPHTFLNYIFLNRMKFESQEIPVDVLLHEAAHARQKHSVDILFVELIQILFWFNPVLYAMKQSIKLNHEFLADETVIRQGSSTADYQNTLLDFASSANYTEHQPSMANAINYSSIRKRFKVMKKQTSKKSVVIRTLLILPLLSLLLYGFSTTVQITKVPSKTIVAQDGATAEQIEEYNTMAKTYNAMLNSDGNVRIKKTDVNRLEYLYGIMTEVQQSEAEPFPDFPEPPQPPMPPNSQSDQEIEKQATQLNKQYEEIEQQAVAINEQAEALKNRALQLQKHSITVQEQQKEIEQQAMELRSKEKALQEIIENQEIYDEVSVNVQSRQIESVRINNQTRSNRSFNLQDENVTIYLDGKEISHTEMKKMEENGTIQTMNVIKNDDGKNIIELNGPHASPIAPPPPPAPKSPLQLLRELQKENVMIIIDGTEVDYDTAEQAFKKQTFSRINVKKENGRRPVLNVATE